MKIRKSLAVLGTSAAMALGLGGVMAPSAQAHGPWDSAGYTQTDLRTGDVTDGAAVESPYGGVVAPPYAAASLHCGSSYSSSRSFTVTCFGRHWAGYVDCSDGNRYSTPSMRGSHRVKLRCPVGTTVVDGGAYGR